MAVVLALLACIVLASLVTLPLVRARHSAAHELPWDLADSARKNVSICGSLAGFSVTGVLLMLSFAEGRAGSSDDALTVAVGMFVVAFISFVAAALLYGNLSKAEHAPGGADLQRLQYSIATMFFYRTILLSWLALRPLLEAYGLAEMGRDIGWLLLPTVFGGWLLSSSAVFRMGLAPGRIVVVIPVVVLLLTVAAALVFDAMPAWRDGRSALYLTYALFGLNVVSFVFYILTPLLLARPRAGPLVMRTWPAGLALAALTSSMLLGFLWLATAGRL